MLRQKTTTTESSVIIQQNQDDDECHTDKQNKTNARTLSHFLPLVLHLGMMDESVFLFRLTALIFVLYQFSAPVCLPRVFWNRMLFEITKGKGGKKNERKKMLHWVGLFLSLRFFSSALSHQFHDFLASSSLLIRVNITSSTVLLVSGHFSLVFAFDFYHFFPIFRSGAFQEV